jgi:hypothetical protein
MRVASLALLVLIASAAAAQARCADDMKRVGQKVERTQKTNPSPQTVAAAKELKRYDERAMSGDADEVDCYNTIARVERALNSPPPADTGVKPGAAVGPVSERAKSLKEQATKE